MSEGIFTSSNVIVFFLLETILLSLQLISFYFVITILKNWDFKATTSLQYSLEKKSYLVTLIIYFTVSIKIILVPYFAYSIDILSKIIPGAMCGAGVISSNEYGETLLIIKIFILFFALLWIVLNSEDIKAKDFPYIRKKFYLFILLLVLIIIEFYLDIKYFTNLSTQSLVTCCSAIYSNISDNPLPFSLSLNYLIILFYIIYVFTFISNTKKYFILSAISNILFLYLSYYSILYFFGTYIYQLPTHHCPFCMLQSDYYYIGYFIFISLFLGTFFGMVNLGLKLTTKKDIKIYYFYSNIFNTIFISICSLYVVVYYLKNGVLL